MQNMLSKRFLIVCILFFGFTISLFAQNDDVSITYHQAPDVAKDTVKPFYKNDEILQKIAVGGWLGIQVGTYTYIELSPDVSYHFNKWVSVGVGGTYIFAHDNYSKESYHVFGARAFVEGHFFNFLGLHAAYQALNFIDPRPQTLNSRIWSNNLSIGGGYYQRSGRLSMYLFILYNRSDREGYNIYGNVLFKVGFNIFLK